MEELFGEREIGPVASTEEQRPVSEPAAVLLAREDVDSGVLLERRRQILGTEQHLGVDRASSCVVEPGLPAGYGHQRIVAVLLRNAQAL